jgi:hypothetical protein
VRALWEEMWRPWLLYSGLKSTWEVRKSRPGAEMTLCQSLMLRGGGWWEESPEVLMVEKI